MMKKRNTDNLSLFYKDSAFFLPTLVFVVLVLASHFLLVTKTWNQIEWYGLVSFVSGISIDLAIFLSISLLLNLLIKYLKIIKIPAILFLYLLCCCPILDYFYFKGTLERFNWIVLNFVNFHSTKGYLGNMGISLIPLIIVFALIFLAIKSSLNKERIIENKQLKPIIASIIFCSFAYFFLSSVKIQYERNFTGHMKTIDGKNRIIASISSGSLIGFLPHVKKDMADYSYKAYTNTEENKLLELGILPDKNETAPQKLKFKKIIMVVLESFANEYLSKYNPRIPPEASYYMDNLITEYPHLDNFYTSDFPSLEGFNAILSGRIPLRHDLKQKQNYNIATIFENNIASDSTFFLRGSSRVYGGEELTILNKFGFSNLIGYEDLVGNYPEPHRYTWGYRDDVLYTEALKIMNIRKEKSSLIILKLLNQHQPISKSVINMVDMPLSVKDDTSDIVKAIYEANRQLEIFISTMKSENLLDDETLIIVTADHYPPLGYGHTEITDEQSHFQLGKLPLIFVANNKDYFSTLDQQQICCQLDLAPTICSLIGQPTPPEHMGRNLLEKASNRSIGILNNKTIFFHSENYDFSENMNNPATQTAYIKKWINNLNAFPALR